MQQRQTNIRTVVKKKLCAGCGTCVSVCPRGAIELQKADFLQPQINGKKCSDCGLCLNVCPGIGVDYSELKKRIFAKEPQDVWVGNYECCFVGHSNDEKIRFDSSSGGLVTSLLIYLLEQNIVDGALVTRLTKENPFEPQPFIARTKEEVVLASKSKYCPVPVNIALREILSDRGKFAYVGLPCHINGLRKMESVNEGLKTKIIFHFGLFCGLVRKFAATRDFILRMGISLDEVESFEYRGKGWPGYMTIVLKNKVSYSVPLDVYYHFFSKPYVLNRCLLCGDLTAELADISFGDPWHLAKTGFQDTVGSSLAIVRSSSSRNLINDAARMNYIDVSSCKIRGDALEGSELKKRQLKARIALTKLFFGAVPKFVGQELIKPKPKDFFSTLKLYIARLLWKTRLLRFVFCFTKAHRQNVLALKRIKNR